MILLPAGGSLLFIAKFSEYVDTKGAIANALGTVTGGLFLTVFYFVLAQKFLRLPSLSGPWVLETAISQTEYNPFKKMVLRYKILLLQDGTGLHGTAEKVYEKSDKERVFTGINRTNATIEGTVRKAYLGRSTIFLHAVEEGERRSFSWILEARCRHFGPRMRLTGQFSSTAGNAYGTVALTRIPIPNQVNEYRGMPLRWFSRLIEIVTAHAYREEWNQLRARIASLTAIADKFWKTHNSHIVAAALVLAEDRRFYSHGGTDPIAMGRALFKTVVENKIQGGSTLEQQLVRLLLSDYRKSLGRKLKEIVLAVRLHRVLQKDQIPVAYLVLAYFGWQMNGVRQAAHRLSINLKAPMVDEAAILIARIRYPEPRHPGFRWSMLTAKRQEWIAREIRARTYLLY